MGWGKPLSAHAVSETASSRHDEPSSGSSTPGRQTWIDRPAVPYLGLVAPAWPVVHPWFENVGTNR